MRYQFALALALSVGALGAQQLKFTAAFERLAEKASETVNVTLDPQTLGFASKFLSEDKKDEAQAKKVASKITGIQVRSFEFETEGAYTEADVNDIRAQLKGPEWSVIVSSRSKKGREISEIYLHRDGGLVILAAEPKELTVVNIIGKIDPSELRSLGGQFGVPSNILPPEDSGSKSKPAKDKDKSKDKEKDEEE